MYGIDLRIWNIILSFKHAKHVQIIVKLIICDFLLFNCWLLTHNIVHLKNTSFICWSAHFIYIQALKFILLEIKWISCIDMAFLSTHILFCISNQAGHSEIMLYTQNDFSYEWQNHISYPQIYDTHLFLSFIQTAVL